MGTPNEDLTKKNQAIGCGCLTFIVLAFGGCVALLPNNPEAAYENISVKEKPGENEIPATKPKLSAAMSYQSEILKSQDNLSLKQTYKMDLLTAAIGSSIAELTLLQMDEEFLYSMKPGICKDMAQIEEENYNTLVSINAELIKNSVEQALDEKGIQALAEAIVYGTALNGCE